MQSYSNKSFKGKKISFLIVTVAEPERKAVWEQMHPSDDQVEIIKVIGRNLTYNVGILGKYLVAHVF